MVLVEQCWQNERNSMIAFDAINIEVDRLCDVWLQLEHSLMLCFSLKPSDLAFCGFHNAWYMCKCILSTCKKKKELSMTKLNGLRIFLCGSQTSKPKQTKTSTQVFVPVTSSNMQILNMPSLFNVCMCSAPPLGLILCYCCGVALI